MGPLGQNRGVHRAVFLLEDRSHLPQAAWVPWLTVALLDLCSCHRISASVPPASLLQGHCEDVGPMG